MKARLTFDITGARSREAAAELTLVRQSCAMLTFEQMRVRVLLLSDGSSVSQWHVESQEPGTKWLVGFSVCCPRGWALTDDCLSAFMTLVIILLHMFWGIVFFDGCEKKKWYALLVVLLTHLLVSALVSVATVLRVFFGTSVHVAEMVHSTVNEIRAYGKMRKVRKVV